MDFKLKIISSLFIVFSATKVKVYGFDLKKGHTSVPDPARIIETYHFRVHCHSIEQIITLNSYVSVAVSLNSRSRSVAKREMETGEQQEFRSPHDVYRRLLDVVSNEKCSPQVLPFEESVVECIVDQIQHMKVTIDNLGSKLDTFCLEQHSLELERFCFVVNQYYRTRIQKIERNAESLVKLIKSERVKAMQLMSRHEIKYLDNYVSSVDLYLNDVLLQNMPRNMRLFRTADIVSEENEMDNKYIFVKVRNEMSVLIDDPSAEQQLLELRVDGQHFLPFIAVQPQLHSASKDLLIL